MIKWSYWGDWKFIDLIIIKIYQSCAHGVQISAYLKNKITLEDCIKKFNLNWHYVRAKYSGILQIYKFLKKLKNFLII